MVYLVLKKLIPRLQGLIPLLKTNMQNTS